MALRLGMVEVDPSKAEGGETGDPETGRSPRCPTGGTVPMAAVRRGFPTSQHRTFVVLEIGG